MAGEDGSTPEDLKFFEALQREPYRFGFFSLVRRLENIYRDKPRIGESVRPIDDSLRLGQEPFVVFSPATLSEFKKGKDGGPDRVTGFFLGLFGPNGPLPMHLTEYARERKRNHRDDTFIAFADVFHHRMLSLFYRAWASAEPTVSFDRKDNDRFSTYVGSTFGIGMPAFRDRDDLDDVGKLHFAGRMALQTKNPEGLMAIVSDFFRVKVDIQEFIGEWLQLPEHQLTRLGGSKPNALLGLSATAGRRVWSCQYKFRLIFGPMSRADYERLLPGGDSLKRLVAIVRNYVGDELSFDVNLILRQDEVPRLQLGGRNRLGWTSWVLSGDSDRDRGDLRLDPGIHRA